MRSPPFSPPLAPLLLAGLAGLSAWAGAPLGSGGPDQAPPIAIDAPADFPLVLDRPGRYRLGADLDVPAGRSGIVITAPGTTLDLDGHSIRGPVLCSPEPQGLDCDAAPRRGIVGVRAEAADVQILNGQVRGFAGLGLQLAARATVQDLLLADNAAGGLHANTSASQPVRLLRVQALRNGGDGFWVQSGEIAHSQARRNAGLGFATGALVRLQDSQASGNLASEGDVITIATAQQGLLP